MKDILFYSGAPPGKKSDGQGWRALTVLKMASERVFYVELSTPTVSAASAARRRLRRKLLGSRWLAEVVS